VIDKSSNSRFNIEDARFLKGLACCHSKFLISEKIWHIVIQNFEFHWLFGAVRGWFSAKLGSKISDGSQLSVQFPWPPTATGT
jgi:hypothetical protein